MLLTTLWGGVDCCLSSCLFLPVAVIAVDDMIEFVAADVPIADTYQI